MDEVLRAAEKAEAVVVAAFFAPEPGAAEAGASDGDAAGRLVQALLDRVADKTVVAAVGSPYVAQAFPQIRSYRLHVLEPWRFRNGAPSGRCSARSRCGGGCP